MAVESQFSSLEIDENNIGWLTFRNPARRNALGTALLQEMERALAELAERAVPVVVLGSSIGEKVWSAGHDISELAEDRDPLASGKPLERVIRQVRAYPGVVIAMVSGSVWGGAVDLVMGSDLVVADETASFSMTPANIGLPYSTSGLLRFFNNLPIHRLKEMFFCATPLTAAQALQFGVLNKMVEQDKLHATTFEIAKNITTKAPLAVQAVKEQLRILEDLQPMPVQAMERIAALRQAACEGADMKEGLEAFLQRRPARFSG